MSQLTAILTRRAPQVQQQAEIQIYNRKLLWNMEHDLPQTCETLHHTKHSPPLPQHWRWTDQSTSTAHCLVQA